jgi:glycosyltransferase involved in cell wall biosynthesis
MRDMSLDPRVDHYLVNSPIIKRRLQKYYKRDSEILYPPIELSQYYNDGDYGYYLHLGRLDEEKGVPEIVSAFEELDERLVMAGGVGDITKSLIKRIETAENINRAGFVSEEEKFKLLSRCSGVVFNGQNEDFGIVPIEANASGKAVIARNDGFPGIFIADGYNGLLHDGTARGIKRAVVRMGETEFSITQEPYISQFNFSSFSENLRNAIKQEYKKFIIIKMK